MSVSFSDVARTNLLRSVGVSRKIYLTPKANMLYRVASNLKKVSRRLFIDKAKNKEKIKAALHFAESPDFLRAKVNEKTLNFLLCQMKMQKKCPRGRRFTFEDKIFALSLLKQSPRAYKVLRNTFALPSRKSLVNLLNQIPFEVGINLAVMNVLKESVDKMEFLDKHCILMFDEMSLQTSLTYEKHRDRVIGFEDLGNTSEKYLKIADHALVLMVKGLKKKWKQPISFYFSDGGMKAHQLKEILNTTIKSLLEVGFIVVGTVCDQYSTNVTAIKQMVTESRQSGHEVQDDLQIFHVNGYEIVAFYDPPHLLKGVRNNFLKYDIKFILNNDQKKASWKHIQQLYELDKGDFNTRMCYKLTDCHIYKDKIKKMKVKYAAQVFSHRVSSTMRWTVTYGKFH